MKKIFVLFLGLLATGAFLFICSPATEKNKSAVTQEKTIELADSNQVVVYYFHSKQRCKTCLAVQQITETTVKEGFKGNNNVIFIEVNFSAPANEAIADKYEISTSSLIIAKGNTHEDLTNIAFANALRNPDEVRKAIVRSITNFLSK